MPPAFLDIVAAFALFRRSAINLTIYRDFDPKYYSTPFHRAHPHYRICTLTEANIINGESGFWRLRAQDISWMGLHLWFLGKGSASSMV